MSAKSALVRKNPKALIPEDYLKRAISHHGSAFGYALSIDTEGKPELLIDASDTDRKVDIMTAIMEIQEQAKDYGIVFHLISGDKLAQDDVQPFVLVKENNFPQLVMFASGNFEGLVPQGSNRPGEFMLYGKYMLKKVTDLYKVVGGKYDALISELSSDSFKSDIDMALRSDGQLTLMGVGGEMLHFGTGDQARSYEWGAVSNYYGYEVGTGSTAKKILSMGEKLKSFMGKGPKGETSPVPQEEKKEDVKPAGGGDVKPVENKKKDTEVQSGYRAFEAKAEAIKPKSEAAVVNLPESGKVIMARAPQRYLTNGKKGKVNTHSIKDWYKFCSCDGVCPRDFLQRPEVRCWENRIRAWDDGVRSIKNFNELAYKYDAAAQISAAADAKPSDAPKGKDTASELAAADTRRANKNTQPSPEIAEVAMPIETPTIPEALPIIGDDELAKFKKLRKQQLFTSVLDTSSRKIKSPEALRAMEQKVPSAFRQLGLKRAQVRNMGPEQCLAMVVDCPEATAYLLFSMIVENNMLIQRNPNDVEGYLGEGSGEVEVNTESANDKTVETETVKHKLAVSELKPTGKVLQPVEKPAEKKPASGLFASMKKIKVA